VDGAARSGARAKTPRSEAGDTLIEVLLAIVVLGMASVALLVAFATTISGSAEHRSLATMDTVLRSAAEEAISQIQQQSNSQFGQCNLPAVNFSLPAGYQATIESVEYWDSATSSFASAQTACVVSTPASPQVNSPQLIQLTVTYSSGTSMSLSFVVDDPSARPVPVAAAATHLVFLTSPGNSAVGTAFATQPVVAVEDANGNIVTSDFSAVTLNITTNTGFAGATLSNNCAGIEFEGVVTFSGCSINLAGSQYTLTATDGSLTSATSGAFNITGVATRLVFTTQPVGGVEEGTAFATEPVVSVEDSGGNVVTTDNGSVALSIGTYSAGNGGSTQGTLGCTNTTVNAVAGVATFANCQITGTAGAGTYSFNAARSGLTTGSSSNLSITAGAATQLVFTTQPVGGANGVNFATQPVVTTEDANSNVVTTSSAAVTLAIATQPGTGAALTCTTNPLTPTNGVATFAGCQIAGKTGSYTLSATISGPITVNSSSLSITVGAASKLVFTTQPVGGVKEGTNFGTEPVVTVEDSGGNTVTTDTGTVALSIGSYGAANGGSTQGTLGCTNTTVSAVAGVATFASCQITGTAGAGTYSLNAARSGLSTGSSNNVSIVGGTATKLVFSTEPVGGVNEGTNFATQPVVSVEDANSNVVTTDTGTVALSIGVYSAGNGGTTKGTLGCTNTTVSAVAGVATFANCQITGTAGAGTYSFNAARSGLTTGSSSNLSITAGAASKLVFTTQPVGGANGVNFATQPVVTTEDANSNVVTTSSAAVTLAIATQPGTGAALTCTTNPLTPTNGVATFAGCQIAGKTGSYTLSATISGPITVNSSSLSITVGAASKLVFTTQPVGGVKEGTNFGTEPVVTVEDSGGNTVTTDTGTVALSIGSYGAANGGSTQGTLGCTNTTVSAVAGVATFASCQITGTAGAGTYSLNAARSGLSTGSSNNVSIVGGTATKLVFSTEPVGGVNEGTNFATQPVVSVEDANSNVVTTDTGTVALSIGVYSAGNGGTTKGTLGCTNTTVSAVAGVATFANCQITGTAGAGTYSFNAARSGLTTGSSSNLSITVGPASTVAITPSPTSATASSTTNVTLSLQIEDAFGNTTTSSGTTTLTLSSPSTTDFFASTLGGTGSLNNTINVTFANGVGTATTYYGDEKAETPTITAKNSGGTTWGTTSALTVTAGTAAGLSFTNVTIDSGTAAAVSCTGTVGTSSFACTISPNSANGVGNSITASVVIIDQFQNPVVNSFGTTITVNLSATGGSITPTSVTIPNGSSTSTSTFKESLNTNSGAGVITSSVSGIGNEAQITDR
jgi:hypothetical protein